jgi:hypothetical protein
MRAWLSFTLLALSALFGTCATQVHGEFAEQPTIGEPKKS